MPESHSPSIVLALGLTLALTLVSDASARENPDPASLPKNSFGWTQEQREVGFAHFDEVFGGRKVARGKKVRELPIGKPIAAYEKGGDKEKQLDSFLAEQKVAGFLVLQEGKIRLERYALGHSREGRWTSQSVAKSVASTLVGAAIQDGYIESVDALVTKYIPNLEGSAYDRVTVRQLLTMSSGVRWRETYGDGESDLMQFFQRPIDRGVDQTVSYMRSLPAEAKPGERWRYNTGETHLIGVLVSSATGKTLSKYLSSKIWAPYGMEQKANWTLNATGQELAGCCLQMSLRDSARFGQFVLDGGRIDGKPVVPEGWFEEAGRGHYPVWGPMGYGYQWWTWEGGTFQALGIHGQMIHIDPERQLVVVISSAWPEAENQTRSVRNSGFLLALTQEIDKEGEAASED